jgi:hypothetical protein
MTTFTREARGFTIKRNSAATTIELGVDASAGVPIFVVAAAASTSVNLGTRFSRITLRDNVGNTWYLPVTSVAF